jgi:hypothetical protein
MITQKLLDKMESDLLDLERRARIEQAKPFYLRRDERIEALRAEYKALHREWLAGKRQTSFDV